MLVSYRCPRVGMNKAKNTKTPFSEVCLKKRRIYCFNCRSTQLFLDYKYSFNLSNIQAVIQIIDYKVG